MEKTLKTIFHIIFLNIIFLLLFNTAIAKNNYQNKLNQEQWDFFPLNLNDFWDYRVYSAIGMSRHKIKIQDSTFINNIRYFKINRIIETPVNTLYKDSSYCTIDSGFVKIISDDNVFPPYNIFKIEAQNGEQWKVGTNPYNLGVLWGKLDSSYEELVFNQLHNIKQFHFFHELNEDLFSEWTVKLAEGIGKIEEFSELIIDFPRYELVGAIIGDNIFGNPVSVKKEEIKCYQNNLSIYPNPVSMNTTITLNLKYPIGILNEDIRIYNILGQLVKNLSINRIVSRNKIQFIWDRKDNSGQSVPSGIYFILVFFDGKTISQKITLLNY